jgi:uncharacterized membrane protein (DUF485 family)
MSQNILDTVKRDRRFQALVAQRTHFAWLLSLAMLAIYFGFIFIIAFAPKTLGTPIGSGVTTIGIPLGLFVIVSAFVLTSEDAANIQCPLWVKSRHVRCKRSCPLYPQKRTCAVQLGMSALCQ